MKKILFSLLIAIGLSAPSIQAQDEQPAPTNMRFVYIAHEVTTPITELCGKLRDMRDDADETGDVLIIYLSDGRTSLQSFTNLPDKYGKERDKQQAYLEVVAALQDANSHDVVAQEDIKNIIQLFDEYNFIGPDGKPIYEDIIFDFYVGSNFWTLGNNEKVIGHLYHDFDMANLPRDIFHLNVYAPRTDHLRESVTIPFGDNNVDGINQHIRILEY